MKLPSEVDSLKCGTKLKIKIAQKNQNNLNNRPPPPPPPPNKKGSKLLPSITFPLMWFSLKAPHGHSMGVTSILKPKKLSDVSK